MFSSNSLSTASESEMDAILGLQALASGSGSSSSQPYEWDNYLGSRRESMPAPPERRRSYSSRPRATSFAAQSVDELLANPIYNLMGSPASERISRRLSQMSIDQLEEESPYTSTSNRMDLSNLISSPSSYESRRPSSSRRLSSSYQ